MTKRNMIWILILLWCIFIFWQSSKPAIESSKESSAVVVKVNQMIAFFLGPEKLEISEGFVRKSGHFIEYMVLGILLYLGIHKKMSRAKIFLTVLSLGTLYAASDEIHQYFVPGRSMRATDVLIDASGICLGLLLLLLHRRREYKPV